MARYSRASLPMTALALLLSLAAAPRAAASGFQLRDQSGSGQGNAYAGISAGGSDISSMFFNPAALTRFSGNHLQFGLTFIDPSSKFSNGAASRSAAGAPFNIAATAIGGPASTGNIAKNATLPTFYAMYSVDDDLKLGLSVNVPFGLTTEYDPAWIGRYQAVKSHLETLDLTPTVAYRLDKQWSFGAAFVARRAKAELTQQLDFGATAQGTANSIGAKLGDPTIQLAAPAALPDGTADVEGSSWAYGYKLGVLYEPTETLHIGLGYQSRVRETLKGTATFSGTAAVTAGLNSLGAAWAAAGKTNAVLALQQVAPLLAGSVTDGPVTAVVNLPSTLSLGATFDVSSTFSLSAEIAQTKWSSFKELRVKFVNSAATGQADSVTTENWKDAMFFALGATCHPGNGWTYRVGLAKDNTPVPDANRTPRIPDADRTWASLGASYEFSPAFGVDAGFSHLFCKDSTVSIPAGSDPTNLPEFSKGSLSGTYKNSIDILSVQARYHF